MRILHRIYVEAVGVLTLAAFALTTLQAMRHGSPAHLIAAAPWLASFILIFGSAVAPRRLVAKTRHHSWPFYAASVVATAAAFAVHWLAGLLALAGTAALLGYTLWFTRQHRPAPVVTVGEVLPDFPLMRVDGSVVSSAALAQQPHVILFYRGNWCPFCMAQVHGVAAQYRELEQRGVKVALISPQRAEDSEELSRRFEAPMDFYVDVDGSAARTLDIVQAGGVPVTFGAGTNGDTVVPTIIITKADGTVAWIHHADDHRVRPEPSTFLEVIDREGIGVSRSGA
ncbi:redoxin domain-containing protein [Demequina sp. TTPB684]|uniref:redoxin domain-containing protein n=1 Tax=unclassified Demequina TaxID=2620311 RepID=UPI001CF3838E|nr:MULTISPECIES: redoxin domain-containing protein [unclassified Demequina]MCB2412237.1 redoxin domain-containing protein [Demequina sp. TTPB684]UPU87781.1 redoxin domain-containing protein [Demequina sp. TMPB413]